MVNYLTLIEQDNVNDLSFLVFNQKLTPNSVNTYTDTLSEEEANAVLQKMLENSATDAWYKLMVEYFKHYPPHNSSVDFLLNNIHSVDARNLLEQIIKGYSIMENQALVLCQALFKDIELCGMKDQKDQSEFKKQVEHELLLVREYCNNPRRMHLNHELLLALHNIDDKDDSVKLVDLYQAAIQKNGRLWVIPHL